MGQGNPVSHVRHAFYLHTFLRHLIFAVPDQSAKNAKIMCLENLALYGIFFQAMKKKTEDISRKLATLCDLLRESKVCVGVGVCVWVWVCGCVCVVCVCVFSSVLAGIYTPFQISPDVLTGLHYIAQGLYNSGRATYTVCSLTYTSAFLTLLSLSLLPLPHWLTLSLLFLSHSLSFSLLSCTHTHTHTHTHRGLVNQLHRRFSKVHTDGVFGKFLGNKQLHAWH